MPAYLNAYNKLKEFEERAFNQGAYTLWQLH